MKSGSTPSDSVTLEQDTANQFGGTCIATPNDLHVSTLHVTNGDSTGFSLRQSNLDGEILVWRDVLHEGPVPAVSDARLREIRADYIAARGWAPRTQTLEDFNQRDRTLTANIGGEYVLWFEADLYDQLQIIQILAALQEAGVRPNQVSLVNIGEYPGVARFMGLGQLTPDALEELFQRRIQLRWESFEYAKAAWTAFRATDPGLLEDISRSASSQLRFVAEAFERLLQEYPWTLDGLGLTQRRILAALAHGPRSVHELFLEVNRRDRRPFLGDSTFFDYVLVLLNGRSPLLRADSSTQPIQERTLTLTSAGEALLRGEADNLILNGIDRWFGGVYLGNLSQSWRFDPRLERLVPPVQ